MAAVRLAASNYFFLAGALRAVDLRAAGFLAADVLFAVVVRFAAVFRAVVFLAAGFFFAAGFRAAVFFAAVVVLTIFAAGSFDPRLIWDSMEEEI